MIQDLMLKANDHLSPYNDRSNEITILTEF